MWLEKEFWPINFQPHPPPFLIIPPLFCHCHGHYQWTKKMILFTITNTFAASLFATELSKIPCLFSHLLINSFYLLNINCCKKCRGSWKYWKSGISHRTPIPVLIPVCEMANSGMGREWKNPFPQFGNGKGMKKKHSHNSGTGREWKKNIPIIWEWERNKKIYSQNSGTEREWKKSIPTVQEREGNEKTIPKIWERERNKKKQSENSGTGRVWKNSFT